VYSHACCIDFEEIMSFSNCISVAALALLPLAATAQQTQQKPDPAAANASVPAPAYTSAFRNYRAAGDEPAAPDKLWRAANDAVQNRDGHAGQMKDSGPGNAASAPKLSTLQDPQVQQGQSTPPADPRSGHDGHHSKGK
jgi:hypothetical protein